MKKGTVYLVGSGPGTVGLMTVRGAELLRTADVVLHDRLLLPEVLELANPGAEIVDVGKSSTGHGMKQEEINRLLVECAGKHARVVRLKGGDPFVFGRGSEEAEACAAAGVDCEVVPGVTSAIAGPALAGIPVTSRGMARSFGVVTARSMAGAVDYRPDYAALARLDTVVILMGCKDLAETAAALAASGKRADTPAALVERASWPDERVTHADLAGIAAAAERVGACSPVLLVVGEAARAAGEARPLSGKRILATRPRAAQVELVRKLRGLGAEVVESPLFEVGYVSPAIGVSREVLDVDAIAFASLHGVRGFFRALAAAGMDQRSLGTARLAAVGPKVAAELWETARLRAEVVSAEARAASLARELCAVLGAGGRVLFPCGSLGRREVPEILREGGVSVVELEVYRTSPVAPSEAAMRALERGVDAVLLYSPTGAQGILPALAGMERVPPLLCIGEGTAGPVRAALPGADVRIPATYDDDGMTALASEACA